ncbi:uncharacterized protein BDV17DRAFT_57232 [Aspergillus undulatus]|uniref:uncharacterized protein n=1 Tax=Aspergillus undulatus TaxID=1810928 RepID=UPI003CCD829D
MTLDGVYARILERSLSGLHNDAVNHSGFTKYPAQLFLTDLIMRLVPSELSYGWTALSNRYIVDPDCDCPLLSIFILYAIILCPSHFLLFYIYTTNETETKELEETHPGYWHFGLLRNLDAQAAFQVPVPD